MTISPRSRRRHHPPSANLCFVGMSLLLLFFLSSSLQSGTAFAPRIMMQHSHSRTSFVSRISETRPCRDVSLVSAVVPKKKNEHPSHDDDHASPSSSVMASTFLGLTLLLLGSLVPQHGPWIPPPVAFAASVEQPQQQQVVTTTTAAAMMDPMSTALSPDDLVVGLSPLPKQEKTTTATTLDLLQPTPSAVVNNNNNNNEYSPVEEVWTLIDKYYIDKSFNGQVCVFTVCMLKVTVYIHTYYILHIHVLTLSLYTIYVLGLEQG